MDVDSKENERIPLNKPQTSSELTFRSCCKVRVLQVILLIFVEGSCFAMRANLGVALVSIVATTNKEIINGTTIIIQPYAWTPSQQGIILSSFFWFYAISQIFGSFFSYKFGGKLTILISTLGTAILSVLSPWSVKSGGFYLFLFIRSMEGCLEGIYYPAMMQFLSKWIPIMERTRSSSLAVCGATLGTIASLYLSGIIASMWSWEAIFYFFGIVSAFFGILWGFLASESPETHPFISLEEMVYIRQTRKRDTDPTSDLPIKSIICSKPLWAIVVCTFSSNYSSFFIMTEVPTFLTKKFQIDIEKSGFFSAIPYVAALITTLSTGYISDVLRRRGTMKITNIRKSAFTIGFFGQTVFFLIVAVTSEYVVAIVCLVIAMAFCGIVLPTIDSNVIDLSPTYASFSIVLSNSFGTIGSILAPLITGVIISEDFLNWQYALIVPPILNFITLFIIYRFCSADTQSWDAYERSQ